MYSQTSFVINSDAQLFTNSNVNGFVIRIKTFCQITAMHLVKEPEVRHGMTSVKTDLTRNNYFNHFHLLIWPTT